MAKIPIANTFSELVEMDFVDYGGYTEFLHIQDTLSRFSVSVFTAAKKKGERTAEMAREVEIPHWLAVFGAPRIIVADQDSISKWEIFRISAHLVISCYKT